MKPISMEQVLSLSCAKQHFQDCYLVASLNALSRCNKGREILKNNIRTDGVAYTVRFNNVKGKSETYLVRQEECDNLILCDRCLNVIPITKPHNPIVKVIEVAMSKLLKAHPEEKPLLSRIPNSNEIFEFNKPSKFLYMFTGVRPIVINENGISITLKKYKNAVENIFKRIAEDKNSCFVAGTAISNLEFANFHCYPIVATAEDIAQKRLYHVNLYDTREQTIIERHSNSIINNMKYICGYFEEMLK